MRFFIFSTVLTTRTCLWMLYTKWVAQPQPPVLSGLDTVRIGHKKDFLILTFFWKSGGTESEENFFAADNRKKTDVRRWVASFLPECRLNLLSRTRCHGKDDDSVRGLKNSLVYRMRTNPIFLDFPLQTQLENKKNSKVSWVLYKGFHQTGII